MGWQIIGWAVVVFLFGVLLLLAVTASPTDLFREFTDSDGDSNPTNTMEGSLTLSEEEREEE